MLTSLPVSIATGALLGFLTGLGTGGGSLLMLWLTLICNMDPVQAKSINLMFFVPAALCATVLRSRRGGIPWKKLLLPTAAGCLTAATVAGISHSLDTQVLKKIFAILLICIGIRELCYQKKNQEPDNKHSR